MSTIEAADRIAEAGHAGQFDKAGKPYIEHARAVAEMLREHGAEAVMAGLLHDVVEDTDVTLDDLRAGGFSEHVVTAVDAVTRREGETYMDFVRRAAKHELGRLVKLADNAHNSSPGRLAALEPEVAAGLARRYAQARRILLAAERPEFDAEVLAAWRVLSDRGLVKIKWMGLVPVGVISADLVAVHIAANTGTTPPDGCYRPGEASNRMFPITACRGSNDTSVCRGEVTWKVVYRSQDRSKIIDVEGPWCFLHGLRHVDRAAAAGSMAQVDLEEGWSTDSDHALNEPASGHNLT